MRHALLPLALTLLASAASAQAPVHVDLEGRDAILRHGGRATLCEGRCELRPDAGSFDVVLEPIGRWGRRQPLSLSAGDRVRVRLRSRRGLRIFGAVLAAVTGAFGLTALGLTIRDARRPPRECGEGDLCFDGYDDTLAVMAAVLGGVTVAGFGVGIGLLFVRDPIEGIRVSPAL
ncbi:MAG: hypothetical protein CMN30_20975 [Sandaracinus sp.]|nr:hypothetical protein [Sandaracinus sp.]|tara:strand:- start:713 stop:1237 length:525 start_codon:yes stop_codon:yes gene_type:complete